MFLRLMKKGAYTSIFVIIMAAYLGMIFPTSALAAEEFSATPNIQIGTNPNDEDSSGIFIGIKDIKDSQDAIVPNVKLAGYQIELFYDHSQVKILDVFEEAQFGPLAINNGTLDITSIAGAAYPGTSDFAKLVFVPLALTGTVNDLPEVTIRYRSLSDSEWNPINVPDFVLKFQRGKIANQPSPGIPNIIDAVAGLQYLAGTGLEPGKVNVVNMASIITPAVGVKVNKPSVKNVISLMQHLVGIRDNSFQPSLGNPAQVDILPNTIDSGYTSPAAISVTGTSTHFASGVTTLRILDSSNQAVTGNFTLTVQNNARATINLAPGLEAGIYKVELTTDREVLVVTLNVVYPGLTFSLGVISPTSFKVTFNHALEDISNLAFTVSNSETPVPVTTSWNEAKTEVTLTSSSNFPKGSYTVVIKDGATNLGMLTLDFVSPKVASIQITSTKLAIASTSLPAIQAGYATYVVLDQYGNDITNTYLANNIQFQCGVGMVNAKNGLITIMPPVIINWTQYNEVVINGYDSSTGASTSATLSVSTTLGALSNIKLNTLTNIDNKVLTAGDYASTWYIDYTATDISGNPTNNYNLVRNGLITSLGDQLTTSSPQVFASVIQDPKDSSKAAIQVRVMPVAVSEDVPVAITATTFSGQASTLNVILKKQASLDTLTLMAPIGDISVDEIIAIPYAAFDQYGTAITKYLDIAGSVVFSGNLRLQADVDGTAELLAGPFTGTGPQTITAMTITGKKSTITLEVHSDQASQLNITSTKLAINSVSPGTQVGYATYRVLDQYGNDITATYPSGSLVFHSTVGSISAQQGVLTLTPSAGLDLQQLATVQITATGSTAGLSTEATLSTSLGTLSDFQLNALTNADNKVLTAGDTGSTWYIDYTATDLNGNSTKNYDLVKDGLFLVPGEGLTTSSSDIKARLVQDPSDSTKAALKVTVSSNPIAEDTPVAITVVTGTGEVRTLNVLLKKQSTVDTFTLMPLAYEIATNETKEMPFAAYDQNGVRVTRYVDLAAYVSFAGNCNLTENADGTAKLLVGPFPISGPQIITALTSTGNISKLTLDIQNQARANSLTIDPSALVSTMQSGAFQTIDCGYEYGGLTVKDQYGRVIDMVGNPRTYQVQAIATGSLTLSSKDGVISPNPAAYGQHGIRIGAIMPGSGTVTFKLVDTQNPATIIDQKSISISTF